MQENESYKKKAVSGTASLSGIGLLAKLVGVIGAVFLARWLSPEDFGVFAVVGFVLGLLKLLNDVGLAVSIIQKEDLPSQEVKSSIFFFQIIIALVLCLFLVVVLPIVPKFYPSFEYGYRFLVYALVIELVLDSLKSVPKALLTREIDFKPIAWVEMCENFVYWAVALSAAYMSLGVWALALAVLLRTTFGTIVFWWISPWRPSFHFRWQDLRGHLGFAIDYQLMRVFDFARMAISPTVISGYFGVKALGIVSWSLQMTRVPQFFVFALDRVGMPLYSRLQNDPNELKKTLDEIISYSALIVTPLMVGLIVFADPLVHFVFTNRWVEGILTLKIYAVYFVFMACGLPLSTCIFSLGKARYLLYQGVVLFISELGITFLLMERYSYNSIAIAQTATGFINFFVLTYVVYHYKKIWISGWSSLLKNGLIGIGVFLLFNWLNLTFDNAKLGTFVGQLVLFLLIYLVIYASVFRKEISQVVRLVKNR